MHPFRQRGICPTKNVLKKRRRKKGRRRKRKEERVKRVLTYVAAYPPDPDPYPHLSLLHLCPTNDIGHAMFLFVENKDKEKVEVENGGKWRKLVAKSSVVPQRLSRSRDR